MDETPLFLTQMVRDWQCRKRGMCCSGQRVPLDEVERRRFERRLRELNDARAERFASASIKRMGPWFVMPQVDHQCVFLTADSLCEVRSLAPEVYPRICKKFPYLSILTDTRQIVDLSFQCPTALQLLAEEATFAPELSLEDPPVESVVWLGDDTREFYDLRGERLPAAQFWALHWSLLQQYRDIATSDPFERTALFAEAITGQPRPAPIVINLEQLAHGSFDPSISTQIAANAGGVPGPLPWIWEAQDESTYALDPLPPLDDHAVLTRYLMHRVLCPTGYLTYADPRFLLTTLFAMLARYRILRARDVALLPTIRELDRTFVHGSTAAGLYFPESTFAPWRAMAALASAELR